MIYKKTTRTAFAVYQQMKRQTILIMTMAKEFEVSERTIQSDLAFLEALRTN